MVLNHVKRLAAFVGVTDAEDIYKTTLFVFLFD